MHVVATAGHVDHGKSTLVRALTGMEPDRWAEERRRGMTIDLGFAWAALGDATVAFVDVPGHERFLPNMLAGVGPVGAALVVVAADEGWSRQTDEHVRILDALQVRHGLLAVTKADRADPAPALADARARLAGTSLRDAETVAVSATTGAGLADLRTALQRLVRRLPPPRLDDAVRLWVDRSFTVRGAGTVVTGTLGAGRLAAGDRLVVQPGGRDVVVRGLQSLGETQSSVSAVARVAVNLRGIDADTVSRGQALVSPGVAPATAQFDVRLAAPVERLPRRLQCHVGTAEVAADVRLLDGRHARLRLQRPLPLLVGDRVVLRDPGDRSLAGAVVLDVAPPALQRRGAAAARARDLAMLGTPPTAAEVVALRGAVRATDLVSWGLVTRTSPAEHPSGPTARAVGEWLVDDGRWGGWLDTLQHVLRDRAAATPDSPWAAPHELVDALELPDAALLPPLAAAAGVVVEPAGIRLADSRPLVAHGVGVLQQRLHRAPFDAATADELADMGLTVAQLRAAAAAGALLEAGPGVWLLPDAPETAVAALRGLPAPFTVGDAARALATSRRVAVPLLELLDRRRVTRRAADGRRTIVGA